MVLNFQLMLGNHICNSGENLDGQSWEYDWRCPTGIPAVYKELGGPLQLMEKLIRCINSQGMTDTCVHK